MKEKILQTPELDVFIKYMAHFTIPKTCWIYPGVVKRLTGITIEDVYKALIAAEKIEIVDSYLEIYCPSCGRTTGNVFRSLSEVQGETIVCINCEADVSCFDHHIVIFKLIKE